MLAHREFILEGDRATSEVRDGIPFSDGSRHEIAKGYFGDLEKPIVTWVDGKGDLKKPMEFGSTYSLGAEFPDATHVRLPATKNQVEMVLQVSIAFR